LLDATFAALTAVADEKLRRPLLLDAMEKGLKQNPTFCFRTAFDPTLPVITRPPTDCFAAIADFLSD